MAIIIMMSGLPATGKSTLATRLAHDYQFAYLSKDHLSGTLHTHATENHALLGYYLLFTLAEAQLMHGISCVVDAVFPHQGFRERIQAVAEKYTAALCVVHTYCSDEKLHRERLETRKSLVPWTPVSWDDIQRLRTIYIPWEPSQALFLDAVHAFDTNLTHAQSYLDNILE